MGGSGMGFSRVKAVKGSKKWIQHLVNHNSDLLSSEIKRLSPEFKSTSIKWLSPLKCKNFTEYRDDRLLEELGLSSYDESRKEFWPSRGPQWDAIAKSTREQYILLEAKANIAETMSYCRATDKKSIATIKKRLEETKRWLGSDKSNDWTRKYYQYANRLAQLYFFRKCCGKDAFLVFLYFVNDETNKPTSLEKWCYKIAQQKNEMGLKPSPSNYVIEIFIDTNEIK